MSKDNFNYEKEIWDIAEYTRDTINRKDFDKVILPFIQDFLCYTLVVAEKN